MDFVGVFFKLLILVVHHKRGLCENNFEVILQLQNVWRLGTLMDLRIEPGYTNVVFAKYENQNRYQMLEKTLYERMFEGKPFTAEQVEFCSVLESTLKFAFKRSDGLLLSFECKFAAKDHLQVFFHSIYSLQPQSSNSKLSILRVVKYTRVERDNREYFELEKISSEAELSVRDISNFVGAETKAYYITRAPNTSHANRREADLIFITDRFSRSSVMNSNMISLCLKGMPDVRFLIRFHFHVKRALPPILPSGLIKQIPCGFPRLNDREMSEFMSNK